MFRGLIYGSYAGFNTQPPEGGWSFTAEQVLRLQVSTHSRLKAAGTMSPPLAAAAICFNTQPPEGGWEVAVFAAFLDSEFQHTAA